MSLKLKRKIYLSLIYFMFFLLANLNTTLVFGDQKLIMASIREENTHAGKYLKSVFNEAFKKMGLEWEYVYYPAKRASLKLEKGLIDGDLARFHNYNRSYPDLIRVEEPLITLKLSAFAIDPKIKVNGWDSLRNTPYRIEYILGHKECEIQLSKIVGADKLTYTNNSLLGLQKLALSRTDIFIENEKEVLMLLKTKELKNAGILLAGPLEEYTVHAFFSIKHKKVAVELSLILKKMREEGYMDRSLDEFIVSMAESL